MINYVAVKVQGVVFKLPKPNRHADVYGELIPNSSTFDDETIEGFVTDDGVFLNREQAAKYVVKNGQVERLQYPNRLSTEDLWN